MERTRTYDEPKPTIVDLARMVRDCEKLKTEARNSGLKDDWHDYYSLRRKLNHAVDLILQDD